MIVIEINGERIEAHDEKEARKLMSKASRAQRKQDLEREEKRATARTKAESAAYRVLCRKMGHADEPFPQAWVFYRPGDKWAHNLFTPHADHRSTHKINAQDEQIEIDHYGNNLVGAVCNGAGFCWLLFLQDKDHADWAPMCCAIGVHDGEYCLAECPGITVADFPTSAKEESAA